MNIDALIETLKSRKQTVAFAESLTGGLLAATVVEVPGASAVVRGGVVAYATDVKASVLGVDEQLLEERGAVDPQVALQMAHGVAQLMNATWGVACTGVAGPAAAEGKPVGQVHIAVVGSSRAGQGDEWVESHQFSGDRSTIRQQTVARAVTLLESAVLGGTPAS